MNKYIDVVLAKAEFTGNFQNSYLPGEIKAMLDEVPAADVVEVRHGHWKTYTKQAYTTPPFTYKIIECSLCRNPVQKYWNFCPWCGADMRGETE